MVKVSSISAVVLFTLLVILMSPEIQAAAPTVNNKTSGNVTGMLAVGTPTTSIEGNDTIVTGTSIPAVATLAALSNVIVEPSNNLYSTEGHYVIGFTTVTGGTIKTITIAFPVGFNIVNAKLIFASGIGSGGISIVGQNLNYTVSSPVPIPAARNIIIDLGKIVNNGATTVTVTTRDTLNNIIDGPTTSPPFALKSITNTMLASGTITDVKISPLAAIAFSKLAIGLLPSGITVNSANIVDGSITKSDISAGSGIVTGAQSCIGKLVTGIDSSGKIICKSISFARDAINTPDKSFDVGGFTSIARGTDGFAVISYYEIFGALEVVHCTDVVCSTHDMPVSVDTGNLGTHTSIAIGADGFPVISYYDTTNQGLKAVHCTNKSCSTHDSPVTIDLGNVGQYTSIAIGKDGLPVISYYDSGNGNLKVVHCASASCITYLKLTLDSTDDVGSYTSIAIGTDGFPVISYHDNTNGHLKAVHCTSADCTSQDTPITLDSTNGGIGSYTSVAIGADGFPVISYYDLLNRDLKLTHCSNTSCSTHDSTTIVDSIGDVGQYTSIAIGKDGLPVISYYDSGNGDLKAVHCLSAACSTHDIPAVLDSTGDVGSYTSIAITAGNFPMISYLDSTNGFLKVAIMGGITLS